MPRRAGIAVLLAWLLAGAPPLSAQDADATPRVLLWPAHTLGAVDPAAGGFVDRALQRAIAGAGLHALLAERREQPPSMTELWNAMHAAHARHAVLAIVWASQGRYVVQLRIVSSDGSGPHYPHASASAETLEQTAGALLHQVIPVEPSPQASARRRGSAQQTARERSGPRPHRTRLYLALHSDSAIGFAEPGFYNHLAGGRLDYRVAPQLRLGAYLGYANLEGREGRAHSVLTYLQLEQRIAIGDSALAVPLRFALGYLMRNGVVTRVGPGLALPLGGAVELVLDLPAAAFWVVRQRVLFSLDLGLELSFTL